MLQYYLLKFDDFLIFGNVDRAKIAKKLIVLEKVIRKSQGIER